MFGGCRKAGLFLVLTGMIVLSGCMEQYDPARYRAQFKQERELAHRQLPKLSEKGEMPAAASAAPSSGEAQGAGTAVATEVAAAAPANPAKAKYDAICAACHGVDGKADSAAAQAMNPKPRNFHDKAWQASVDDARIRKAIKEGGAAVGLSPMMAPMGAMLNDAELDGMVQLIREWGK